MASDSIKYEMLLKILDTIREEARGTKWATQYALFSINSEAIQQARSKAYIHLFIKVMFGIFDFSEREAFITDGPDDGGVDGYYIDYDTKRIYMIQSKFRNTAVNFESKKINADEILAMDIDRITKGHEENERGVSYNGKIKGFIRRISEIPDPARYNYNVIIIANCDLNPAHLRRLTDGFHSTVFNFERSYNELVFPIVSGTFFKAADVSIQLDLSNKSAGAKTSYTVATPFYSCEITVLFIPALEIARSMDKYRNSILEYNPRSYLDLQEGKIVHESIKETLLRPNSNEFALMNNGITILSDETNFSERIGQHNKAQLQLRNPQIINGGQTAYTLSRTYSEDKENSVVRLGGKEVLTKVITLTPIDASKDSSTERLRLIDEISAASNRQIPVVGADRVSNSAIHVKIQNKLFNRYGILYERKRGEFSDGIASKYISNLQVLDRNLFVRILLATKGQLMAARRKRILLRYKLEETDVFSDGVLDTFYEGYRILMEIRPKNLGTVQPKNIELLAKVYIGVKCTSKDLDDGNRALQVEKLWIELMNRVLEERPNFVIIAKDGTKCLQKENWIRTSQFSTDVVNFVNDFLSERKAS